jgi:hypothetical protein
MSCPVLASHHVGSFKSPSRVHRSLTAAIEKRALEWMARRAPRWLTSDQLTILGLVGQIGAGAAYILVRENRYALLLVNFCIVLNWLGDSRRAARSWWKQAAKSHWLQKKAFALYISVVMGCVAAAKYSKGVNLLKFGAMNEP